MDRRSTGAIFPTTWGVQHEALPSPLHDFHWSSLFTLIYRYSMLHNLGNEVSPPLPAYEPGGSRTRPFLAAHRIHTRFRRTMNVKTSQPSAAGGGFRSLLLLLLKAVGAFWGFRSCGASHPTLVTK
eukprot:sb/3475578/